MTFTDENGNIITLEISDNTELLEAFELQTEKLEELREISESQAEIITAMQEQFVTLQETYDTNIKELSEMSQERYETYLAHTEAQEAKIAEMNQYTAYIFVIVLAVMLYRILSGALSSIFGGG